MIAERIDTAPEDKLLHIHTLLVLLGADLRYPERSRTEETPWSIVQPTEEFLQSHLRVKCKFIIRPQWSYNYGLLSGLIEAYTTDIKALSEWISLEEWKDAIGSSAEDRVYCVSFPRIEKMNVLSHVNWGHEVGHILAADWLRSEFPSLWKQFEPQLTKILRDDYVYGIPAGVTIPDDLISEGVADAVKRTMHLARTAFKELICDAVGVHLFGPATLASLAEFSCHRVPDASPLQTGGYPPWRYRLRMISNTVIKDIITADTADWHHTLAGYVSWIQEWHELLKSESDKAILESSVRTKEAYRMVEQHWSTVWSQVVTDLPDTVRKPYKLTSNRMVVEELIERLRHGIPPNETGSWPTNHPASLADIWNAAWACKIQHFRGEKGEILDEHVETLSHLTLKAIEASYVQKTFGPRLREL